MFDIAPVTVTYSIRNRQNVSVLRTVYERRGIHYEDGQKIMDQSVVRHLDYDGACRQDLMAGKRQY